MSLRPSVAILENASTQAGEAWETTTEGTDVSTRNKGTAIVAKDESDLATMLLVRSSDGRLLVDGEGDDLVDLKGEGDNAGSGTVVTLFDITLQASTVYKDMEWIGSCFREATFEMLWIDDLGGSPVETILGTVKVGSGAYTSTGKLTSRFTTGGTGTQVLRMRAINQNALSQIEGAVSVKEVQ